MSGALPRQIKISGESFSVTDETEGTFDVRRPKLEVYADALPAMLTTCVVPSPIRIISSECRWKRASTLCG